MRDDHCSDAALGYSDKRVVRSVRAFAVRTQIWANDRHRCRVLIFIVFWRKKRHHSCNNRCAVATTVAPGTIYQRCRTRYDGAEVALGTQFNPLQCKGNFSATPNNTKLVHWPLLGGLLHLRWYSEEGTGQDRSSLRPILAVPNVTAHPSTASVPITVLLYNCPLLCGFNVPIKGLPVSVVHGANLVILMFVDIAVFDLKTASSNATSMVFNLNLTTVTHYIIAAVLQILK